MGREIDRLAPSQRCQIVARHTRQNPFTAETSADVAIEFTRPGAVLEDACIAMDAGLPLVVGTTGWLSDLNDLRRLVEERQGRIVYGSNFSVGVNLFLEIVRQAALLFASYPEYDSALHELHHRRKADAPSGTALTIARLLLNDLPAKSTILAETPHHRIDPASLHVSSTRVGATPGIHTVYFDSDADTVELTHRARGREGFALGALAAARWITQQPPGLYRFEDDIIRHG